MPKNNSKIRKQQRKQAAAAREEKWGALTIDQQIDTRPGLRVVVKLKKRKDHSTSDQS